MPEIRYDAQGQPYELVPGSRDRWKPVDARRAEAASEVEGQSGIRQTAGAIANAGQRLAIGARSLGGALGMDIDEEGLAEDRAKAEAYRQALIDENAVAAGIGMGAEYAPDAAAMVASGGSTALGRVAVTAGLEAGLGAIHSPDAPLTGAVIGAAGGALAGPAMRVASVGARKGVALAETAISTARRSGLQREATRAVADAVAGSGRFGELAEPMVRGISNLGRRVGVTDVNATRSGLAGRVARDLNAAKVEMGEAYQSPLTGLQERIIELGDRGVPTTEGDMRFAMAQTDEARAAAERMRFDEDVATSNPLDVRGATVKEVWGGQEDWLTKEVGNTLENPNVTMLDDSTLRPLREQVGKDFDDLLELPQNTKQVELTAEDVTGIRNIFDSVADVAKSKGYQDRADEITRIIDSQKPLSGKDFAVVRNKLNETRERLLKSGSTHDAGVALSEVEDILTSRFKEGLSPDDQAKFAKARHKWRVIKALEANLRSTTPGGKINTTTFANAYLGKKPNLTGDEFGKDLEAMRFLASRTLGNSGTAERLQGGLLGKVAQGAGLLGLGGMLGG